jgi:hypothetical protein
MEFRIEKTVVALMVFFAGQAILPAEQHSARHIHWRKSGAGTLKVTGAGITFEEPPGKKKPGHRFEWAYQDIQQLEITPRKMRVLTYQDNQWKLGADREQKFVLTAEDSFHPVYQVLKSKLDQRFVAALADDAVKPLWQLPVKRLGAIKGAEGVLVAGEDRLVYKTGAKDDSRTWRYADIDNVSTSGPFDLTLVTYERARSHYGNLKQFHFQLKQALDEERYNDLWRRLNQTKGLRIP